MIIEPDDYPDASEFTVGEALVALKEISPRVPKGSRGRVVAVLPATNEVHIAWATPSGEKVTKGSPAHSWGRVAVAEIDLDARPDYTHGPDYSSNHVS